MNLPTPVKIACTAALFIAPYLHAQTQDPASLAQAPSDIQSATVAPAQANAEEQFVPDEVLVGFKPGAAAAQHEAVRGSIGAKKLKEFAQINVQHWKLPPGLSVARAIQVLSANPNVRYAEPNYIVRTNQAAPPFVPNDEFRGDLWGMHNVGQNGGSKDADIDALEAWQLPVQPGGAAVVVGIIDTGVDYTHPDLVDKIWTNPREIAGDGIDNDGNGFIDDVSGWDFVNNDNDARDDNRHGTHVAGTIAGTGNNGRGVIGVAGLNPNVRVVPIKFLSAGGSGTTDAAISSVLYSASLKDAQGNQVIRITNNSWGGGAASTALEDAIRTSGTLFIAAAGNNGTSTVQYPGGYALSNVLTVAATDANDRLATFSNFGTWVHLAAPGVNIVSATPGDTYSRLSGTSMATPHVVGAAALLLSQNPAWTTAQLKDQLINSGDGLAVLVGKTTSGNRLNVARALGAPELPSDDITPPNTVLGLVIAPGSITQTSLVIDWPTSGDGSDGAYLYDVRYRVDGPVDDSNWSTATPVYGESVPPSGGTVAVQALQPSIQYTFAIRAIDIAGNASPISTNVTAKTLPVTWRPEVVDTTGAVGDYRSLAFDPSGRAVIAYSDQTNNRVKLATRNGSSWSFESFGTGYGGVSLALAPGTGVPAVSWASSKLYFASRATGAWAVTTLEKSNVQGDVTSLAYAPDGTPAISYRVLSTGGGLKFAWRSGSTWKTQVAVAGAAARYSSLAFKSNGDPVIAYSHDADADNMLETLMLVQGTKPTTPTGNYTWSLPQAIDTGVAGYGVFCSLATDPADNALVVHRGAGWLRFLRQTANGWMPVSEVDSASNCDLVVKNEGAGLNRVYIAYATGGRAKVARALLPSEADQPDWELSLAENETSVGGTPSIDVTAARVPSMAYNIGGDLRFTTEDPNYVGPSYVFQDDMEVSNPDWTTEGDRKDSTPKSQPPGANDPNDGNLWHRTMRRGNDPGHTPIYSWYYGDENQGNYDTGARNWGRLKSPPITIPQGTRAELKVAQLAQAEGGSRYENAEIQVRVAGGNWTTLLTRASRTSTSFITDTLDLTPYLGKTIQIGFFFDTKDSNFNQFEGWYVDDVNLKWWP